jgi:hypothetical protein
VRRAPAAAALAVLLTAVAGCGLGAGRQSAGASMIVTRDFGSELLGSARVSSLPGEETQMRFLERRFRVRTRYGGRYVDAINGLAEGQQRGRPAAWLYYVNGISAPKGAAETRVHAGDRIWWDHHEYSATRDTPAAVVGAFPAPFRQDLDGKRPPVRLECASDAGPACGRVAQRLAAVGVVAPRALLGTGAGRNTLRVLVGRWSSLRSDGAAAPLERGPAQSGVYVRPSADGRRFALLDPAGRTAQTLSADTGLVAATRFEQQEPAWLVTGTDAAGLRAAADSLTEGMLERRFALVVTHGKRASAPGDAGR